MEFQINQGRVFKGPKDSALKEFFTVAVSPKNHIGLLIFSSSCDLVLWN